MMGNWQTDGERKIKKLTLAEKKLQFVIKQSQKPKLTGKIAWKQLKKMKVSQRCRKRLQN